MLTSRFPFNLRATCEFVSIVECNGVEKLLERRESQRLFHFIDCHIERFTRAGFQLEYDLGAGRSFNQGQNGPISLRLLPTDSITFPMTKDFPGFNLMWTKLNRGPFLSFDKIQRFTLPTMRHFRAIQRKDGYFPRMNLGIECLGGNDIAEFSAMVTDEIPDDLVDGIHRR